MRFKMFLASAVFAGLSATATSAYSNTITVGESPIDIRPAFTQFDANLSPLRFEFNQEANLSLFNSGSPDPDANIRAELPSGSGTLILDNKRFDFLQFHFHTTGEHGINGRFGDAELHRVFRNPLDGQLAVVGQVAYFGAASPKFETFFNSLPGTAGQRQEVDGFDLARELPDDLRSFRYNGSLTTFNFAGNVEWNLLVDPLEISRDQLARLAALFPEGNTREVQDIGDRTVLTDIAGFNAQSNFAPVTGATSVPEPASLTLLGLAGLGTVAARRRLRRQVGTAG